MSNISQSLGSVVSVWQYPVKSMMGEELNSAVVTEHGLLGDRAYALMDLANEKIVSAKNPRKWPNLFDFQAIFVKPPHLGKEMPPVRISLPNGTVVTSDQSDINQMLSNALGHEVKLVITVPKTPSLEEYWPDIDGLDHRETVTDESMPEGMFFDLAPIHLLTTATIDRLREVYPQGRFEVRRFRPNIVIDPTPGEKNFVENDWVGHTLSIGDEVRLRITSSCPRCVMITLPQGDLPRDLGILRTAVQYNQGKIGVYAKVVQGGTIHRGDSVKFMGSV